MQSTGWVTTAWVRDIVHRLRNALDGKKLSDVQWVELNNILNLSAVLRRRRANAPSLSEALLEEIERNLLWLPWPQIGQYGREQGVDCDVRTAPTDTMAKGAGAIGGEIVQLKHKARFCLNCGGHQSLGESA